MMRRVIKSDNSRDFQNELNKYPDSKIIAFQYFERSVEFVSYVAILESNKGEEKP